MKAIKLKHGDEIKFTAMHHRYGRAEFIFCPVLERGKLKKVFIQRAQQETSELFLVDCGKGNATTMSIESYTHKGIEIPRVWLWNYCHDHKTLSFRVYVPANATKIDIHKLSGVGFTFDT